MPLRGLLGFVGRNVCPEARLKASLRRGEVVVAGDRPKSRDARCLRDVQELFQLLRLAHQPVDVPTEHSLDDTFPHRLEHLQIRRTRLVRVLGRADVVVDEDAVHDPAEPLCELAAVLFLVPHTETLGLRVLGNADVDRYEDRCKGRHRLRVRRWLPEHVFYPPADEPVKRQVAGYRTMPPATKICDWV